MFQLFWQHDNKGHKKYTRNFIQDIYGKSKIQLEDDFFFYLQIGLKFM